MPARARRFRQTHRLDARVYIGFDDGSRPRGRLVRVQGLARMAHMPLEGSCFTGPICATERSVP